MYNSGPTSKLQSKPVKRKKEKVIKVNKEQTF